MTNRIVPITESVNPESTNRWLPGMEDIIYLLRKTNLCVVYMFLNVLVGKISKILYHVIVKYIRYISEGSWSP